MLRLPPSLALRCLLSSQIHNPSEATRISGECDLTGIVSRAGVVAGDMWTYGTGTDGIGTGNGA